MYSEYSKACNYQPLKINNVKVNNLRIKIIDHIFLQYKNQGFHILVWK